MYPRQTVTPTQTAAAPRPLDVGPHSPAYLGYEDERASRPRPDREEPSERRPAAGLQGRCWVVARRCGFEQRPAHPGHEATPGVGC